MDGVRLGDYEAGISILQLFLFAGREKVFSKEEIFEAAWGRAVYVVDEGTDVHISNILSIL